MALNPSQLCGTLNSLNTLASSTLSALTSRLYALKSLANILESVSLKLHLPDPASLIPVSMINDLEQGIAIYNQIELACPGLLPPLDVSLGGLNKLRQMLSDAYNTLYAQLLQHPLAKLAQLDSELNSLINKAVGELQHSLIPSIGIMGCLEQLCATAKVTPSAPPELVQGVLDTLQTGLDNLPQVPSVAAAGGTISLGPLGSVTATVGVSPTTGASTGLSGIGGSGLSALTPAQQSKVTQFQTLQQTVARLAGITVPSSPTPLPAASASTQSSTPTTGAQEATTPAKTKTGVTPVYTQTSSLGGGGGGGAVASVNGQTGAVVLTAASVGADPSGAAAAITLPGLGAGNAAIHAAADFDAAGAASTAQGASLQKSSNLSDLASASFARTSLGLGTAATHAAGDFQNASAILAAFAALANAVGNLANDGAGNLTWVAASAGTKTLRQWQAGDAQLPASLYALFFARNQIAVLEFDPATNWSAVFIGFIPEGASTANGIEVRIFWMGKTATSGNVIWTAAFEQCAASTEDTDHFAAGVDSTASACSGTTGIPVMTAIDLTSAQIASLVAGDLFRLQITRNAVAAGDTMTGNAQLMAVEIRSR